MTRVKKARELREYWIVLSDYEVPRTAFTTEPTAENYCDTFGGSVVHVREVLKKRRGK
jgi:hypothetical protein